MPGERAGSWLELLAEHSEGVARAARDFYCGRGEGGSMQTGEALGEFHCDSCGRTSRYLRCSRGHVVVCHWCGSSHGALRTEDTEGYRRGRVLEHGLASGWRSREARVWWRRLLRRLGRGV